MGAHLHSDLNDTICALATPAGTGAIGVIRVSGSRAIEIVNILFKGKDLAAQASHTIHFGKITDGSRIIDEVLASLFVAPKSYTGEHTVELSCHGSTYIQQQILQLLVQHDCRLAKPGEFTLRAFLNKKLDLSQAEAVADLIASDSAESHKMAMQQMRGGFGAQINQMRTQLVNFASLIELELDFSEEDVEFAAREELLVLVSQIAALIQNLLDSFNYGNAIKNGIPTVIAGKPNAGKSTLLNALINEERAIVSDIAGTTRDTIEEAFVIDGITFRLIDTAGIRQHASDAIEEIGIERAFEKLQKASIIMYVFDATLTTAEQLTEELKLFSSYPAIVIPVANKTDALTHTSAFNQETVSISAKNNIGMELLKQRLVVAVRKDEIKNDIIITNLRHYEALKHTADTLQQVLNGIDMRISGELLALDIRKALFHLAEITGEVTTDDLLANIFSKFCIGK
ncbi:MAG: tRNA uridine-5-carboxymethylaminomethyl(34) synthesis GTPase MnmE [Bacteroidota bacterium]|jgi:tRNA modification GTPase|nr:tRNA uridine-5-carboxymethylaminomethyl(34) synthesis GTPase MnmE [Sphingobacteriales bacterium]